MTIKQFIKDEQLELEVTRIPFRTDIDEDTWADGARHWACQLYKVGFGSKRPLNVYYSQGSAHKKPPTLENILECLASEARSVDESSFDNYCSEYGFDTDSHKASQLYELQSINAQKLKKLLGDTSYLRLLKDVDC